MCEIPIQTRSKAAEKCTCRWCKLARLSGPEFKLWQLKMTKSQKESPLLSYICQSCGKGVKLSTVKHSCCSTDLDRVQALVNSIPMEVKGKLTLALLQEQEVGEGVASSRILSLPQARGGQPVEVQVAPVKVLAQQVSLSLQDWEVAGAKAHLSGVQKESLAADLCAKLGRRVLEPGLKLAQPLHNKKFSKYFKAEKRKFEVKEDKLEEKMLFFCHSPQSFLDALDQEQGKMEVPQATLISGDSGQGYTKLCVSRVNLADLYQTHYTRVPGPGLFFLETEQEESPSKKLRRTREEGVQGGEKFSDWGVRKMMILAIVHKVKETAYNLEAIFNAVGLCKLEFRLTGDFAFLMPCSGLIKGCSSTNPCPLCDRERTKEGGGQARWLESDVSLRSFGSLFTNFGGWVMEGEKPQAASSRKWKGVTGPVMVMGEGDTMSTLIIENLSLVRFTCTSPPTKSSTSLRSLSFPTLRSS